MTYRLGHAAGSNKTELYYTSKLVESKNDYIKQLKEQREQYELRRKKLESMVKESQSNLLKLRADADNIRLQLSEQFSRARPSVPSSDDRFKSTGKCDCGRIRKMEAAVKAATNLIQERDEIAEQYNQLRAQCRLN